MVDHPTHYEFGGDAITADQLQELVLAVYQVCLANSWCEVIALAQDVNGTQSIIADFGDGTFDMTNPVGIHRTERLAISYCESEAFPWEVRALRRDFPRTGYQQHSLEGQPRILCLYMAAWKAVQRSWTPQLFITRIFWWLRSIADETILGHDQVVEQLFFTSPYTVVLPQNYFDDSNQNGTRKLVFTDIPSETANAHTYIGNYADNASKDKSACFAVPLLLEPIEHGPIEGIAYNLGELAEMLQNKGCDLVTSLKSIISALEISDGILPNSKDAVLLVLGIPRLQNGEPRGIELQGFLVNENICGVGEKLAVLYKEVGGKRYFKETTLSPQTDTGIWKSVTILPVNITSYPNEKTIRQYSGLPPDDSGPVGIIAGVGALGSVLARIWSTECWGSWHFIDSDIIQAHNPVRHIATHHCIGLPKAKVVDAISNNIHPASEGDSSRAIVAHIESDTQPIRDILSKAELLVDATTTLHVPRIFARCDDAPRTASIFLTPSGSSAVLLLEDKARQARGSCLEAQYYRAILDYEWGKNHLRGNSGKYWVGGGCREVTLALSNEILHLHGGNLARQLRKMVEQTDARICIWDYDDESGAMTPHSVKVSSATSRQLFEWRVVWDEGFLNEAQQMRKKNLPSETGGILLGILDHKDKTITLVKACPAPPSSEQTPSSFSRAGYDDSDFIRDCMHRTADIVTYVGEWHSHPKGVAPLPSSCDIRQHDSIHASLAQEGQPALMMIVSDKQCGFYIDDVGVVVSTVTD